MIKIDDFHDFNYERVAFDISGVDKKELRSRLEFDYINHLYELDKANYIAIWNVDLQGFERESDIHFFDLDDSIQYVLYKLVHTEDGWYREFIGERLVRYEMRIV